MAKSHFESEQYTSESFVESAGSVLFRLSSREISKGRRNCGETRRETALREVTEETGFACRLLPVNMHTRAPPAIETEQLDDRARFYTNICEPFALQIRHLGENEVKIIWWFVAAVNEEVAPKETMEDRCMVEFYSYTDVLNKLTFQMDHDLVKKAVELVENTYAE
ncbi:hypothetical protein GGI42DRAFT_345056 [Trichoderma sp. SZMC 28013]